MPFIVRVHFAAPAGRVDRQHLVSNGLDLLPTFCDYAGIDAPADLAGLSLRPLVHGRRPNPWRTHVPVESEFGAMAVTLDHKYMLYDAGSNREQLIDLQADPHETRNAAGDPAKRQILADHRRLLDGEH